MNNAKLYVGNLPYSITSDRLREVFSQFGQVVDAVVISDKFSGRSKGFGFVTFANDEEAKAAVQAMDQKELEGRTVTVNVARPMQPREDRRPR